MLCYEARLLCPGATPWNDTASGEPRLNEYDLLIIGGGINGAAIARDAAGRGLKVLLVEREDFAQHTSSASSKLIHGGLRYLETFEFRLVREALQEREVMLATAPHLVTPLEFILPHSRDLRPAWLIRLGLFLYDHLGGRISLPSSRGVRLDASPFVGILQPGFLKGFSYSDAWVDDARLVLANLLDAHERGAEIRNRTALLRAERAGSGWSAQLEADGVNMRVRAKALVNAGGPWVGEVLAARLGLDARNRLRLVKGSHIVVDRIHPGDAAFILQNDDKRIVFVLPYLERFSLIGTTDIPWEEDPGPVDINPEEVDYLCAVVNRHFRKTIGREDVRHSFAGIRPLYDDEAASASAVTRDYVLEFDAQEGAPPLLSVFGGKITTARRMAEHALEKLRASLGFTAMPWTAQNPLPGGDLGPGSLVAFRREAQARWPHFPPSTINRLAAAHGTRIEKILAGATRPRDLGFDFGGGLSEAEIAYLRAEEWARNPEDILWRRTKLGLLLPPVAVENLTRHLEDGTKPLHP